MQYIMSVAHSTRPVPPYQPFQCSICQSRFTRHENLKRHAALHSRSSDEVSLACGHCSATFSRPDLRHRHMKRKHPEHHERRTVKRRDSRMEGDRSCSVLRLQLSGDEYETGRASRRRPSARSLRRSPSHAAMEEVFELDWNLIPEPPSFAHADSPISSNKSPGVSDSPARSPSHASLVVQDDWFPSDRQIRRGRDLFFDHVSCFLPFLHQATFDTTQVSAHLILSILSLAYQYGDDPEREDESGSGATLSVQCFHRARALIPSHEDDADDTTEATSSYLITIQSYLLLQVCAMMYLCGESSTQGLKMHTAMISLARSAGLMQPTPTSSLASTSDLDSLWRAFIHAESHKRTIFAVHQIDALYYQLLSIPRCISHLEIKHDLPCPENQWSASTSAEWAHLQLTSRSTTTVETPTLQYADAIRHFLSSTADVQPIAPFDPYGAINIAQFLISSAREISGWSTMTGMLSMERFGALRSSLTALGPYLRPEEDLVSTAEGMPRASSVRTITCAATWETAMLELQMWSPLHTGGIVGASIDTWLQQSTRLAPTSCEVLCEVDTVVQAVQPHVDWFLGYLDRCAALQAEAPWVLLYAYQAFLVAWQLVRWGVPGAMGVVGVADGDGEGALRWARTVFGRRERWQIGRLIGRCLDELRRGCT
ncbi:hypothetical protein ASPACDRAFT_1907244 [Aspergillus aculeatus ATCC 16872]|uniref:C2H2-type domain-containing protein n=1 Tax=Aspergillus aculeatus (strain ATCC 16872 / CBS 172.66 / WB 5094) TaxID=690307 RepID=A0A1L9WHL2_ASPA1|nr:uncharacterized protein ASPACDRAFT_1907244 [Aspergillus aculeatus ATCC 16872]OJJ95636.1 hypothetical protein ASPACDRAFT_1907244 [Aspergillus aculeatus ATCC 16872]